ncbi:DUF5317 family protein [Thermotoga sp. KOL6]|uniref:DUF5317 family protein n=1 Tax=Thermotoga sp. KOL6 TaxID=126741 RepID=UPI000C790BED|nr:DUF5317 family protein [Thermotoga sp. KOL6]PLV60198.1 hypothetical protein AS005_02605 [Thermotoga sp. KOL6]
MMIDVFVIALILSLLTRNIKNVLKYKYRGLYIFIFPFILQLLPWKSFTVPISFVTLLIFLALNRQLPGFKLMTIGAIMNGFTMSVNGGKMPVWEPTLKLLNLGLDFKHSSFTEFSWRTILADYIPVYLPWGRKFVISIGDIFVFVGVFIFFVLKPRFQNQPSQVPHEL